MYSQSAPISNLATHLKQLAVDRPDDLALIQVDANGDTRYTYAELYARACAVAGCLSTQATRGDRALLMMDSGIDYVAGFFGCLLASVIAVPAFPPESVREQHLARLRSIASDADARFILTTTDYNRKFAEAFAAIAPRAALVELDAPGALPSVQFEAEEIAAADIAFLQYTSGSTSAPKGVMVTHGNIVANEVAIRQSLGVGDDDIFVTWLPLFHDMGMIGALLQPVFSGIPVALMSPQFFLERPIRWLQAISRIGGTISGGPDFAYRLCADRIRESQLDGLDLSSWRVAFSGSEPVRADTLERFTARFAPHGMNASAIYPCYGLAEATLLVSGVQRGAGMAVAEFDERSLAESAARLESGGARLVSCGQVAAAHEVRIEPVDERSVQADGRIGEIWVSGPSVTKGYWKHQDATNAAFVERDGKRWLRTGDLGFVHEQRVFIVGRQKDLIIVRGRNIFPEDIEEGIERDVELVRKGRIAAFSVKRDGVEGIGVAAEVSPATQKQHSAKEIVAALQRAVILATGESLSVALLLRPGALPKTSSGKLQRGATRQGWEKRSLDAYATYEAGKLWIDEGLDADSGIASLSATEQQVAQIWREIFDVAETSAEADFFALGGDSLSATQIAARVRAICKVDYEVAHVFEHPSLAGTATLIDRLAESRRPTSGGIIAAAAASTATQAGRPLSFAQQRQWFLWNLDPQSTAYHIGGGLRFTGYVNVELLQAAFRDAAQRHSALRTTFEADANGVVSQIVHAHLDPELTLTDLSADEQRDERVASHVRVLMETPFDLGTGPLLRVAVFRLADNEHVLVAVMHHIVSDAWSIGVLLREIARIYTDRLHGNDPAIVAPAIQYADYAAWQRERFSNGQADELLAYWRNLLGDVPPVLTLPTESPRFADTSLRAQRLDVELPPQLVRKLDTLTREGGLTRFMVLLAGFQILMSVYGRARDVVVGVPVANRTQSETEQLIGFFVNTLVLRAQFAPHALLGDVLAQVRASVLGALNHQDMPFDVLVEALQPERTLGHTPLFQVMFNHLHDAVGALGRFGDASVSEYPVLEQHTPFELSLDTHEHIDGRITARFVFAEQLFNADTIGRMARHYMAVLDALTAMDQRRVADLQLSGADERGQLIALGRNEVTYPLVAPVHLSIARQARNVPDRVAVICGEQTVTYCVLNARANRLAHRLTEAGIGPESRVGVALERSPEMMIALLAILKAGAAYVPLDPSYPAGRLAHMIDDSRVTVVLTQRGIRASLPLPDGLRVIECDDGQDANFADIDPAIAVEPDNLAYVIYTSGSTGKSKGVAIPHQALARHTDVSTGFFGLRASDRVLQFSTINFDGFIEQVFPTLVVGATLVMRGADLWDSDTFYHQVARHEINVADLTTAYWTVLAQDFERERRARPASLRRIHAGGEAMSVEGLRAWRALDWDGVELFNTYGPTEAAVTATCHDCTSASVGMRTVPIGRPLAGRAIYLLDDVGNLVPPGVSGELCIGGELLARGYLNRPALTAERFIPDPFRADGGRLYRTGDMARWRADGQLDYIGRVDHQVKVRGFRVELGEIEAQLLALDAVRNAVVVAHAEHGVTRLAAYVAAQPGADANAASLRASLAAVLPDYMIPGAFVVLDALPLNPNGKLDRHALPAPEFTSDAYAAPQGDAEEALAAIWAQVLRMGRVGRHDNFFEAGGDSILSLQIVALARQAGWTITPRQLFECQTIAELASVATKRRDDTVRESAGHASTRFALSGLSASEIDRLPLRADEIEDLYPLSPMQLGMLFHSVYESGRQAYVTQLRLDIDGLDASRFRSAWEAAMTRHPVLRTGFVQHGEGWLQWVAKTALLPFGEHNWQARADAAADLDELASAELETGFDLAQPPLQRLVLIKTGATRHHLIWTHHHLLMDGWSMSQLLGEILRHYNGEVLPVNGRRYRDYIAWLQRQDADAGEAYWRGQLANVDEPTRLAGTLIADPASVEGYAEYVVKLDVTASERLAAFARAERVTVNTVIQGAWAVLLQRYTGQRSVVFGATVAGRPAELAGSQDVLGLFINTLPVVAQAADGTRVGAWLRALQAQSVASQEHAHTPLYQIQRWAGVSGEGLFDTLVVFENYPVDEALEAGGNEGLTLRSAVNREQTNYALTLSITQSQQITLRFGHARDVIGERAVQAIARHMSGLLGGLVSGVATRVGELVLVDDVERSALLALARDDERYVETRAVHEVIAARARRFPDVVAVVYGEQRVSYGELEERANRLAHRLIKLGVGPEVRVGIAVERSVEMVVGLLAILKAGGAYVPLDPEYPRERLAYMLEDSGITLLLTQSWIVDTLPVAANVRVVELDTEDVSTESAEATHVQVQGENLAYVIYTSGSTGKPKGAANRHSALTNRLVWMQSAYALNESDVVLQKTPFSFDVSVWEFFWPLMYGAKLAVAEPGAHRDPQKLVELIHRHDVTTLHFVPSMLQAFVAHENAGTCTGLKRIVCSGEALPAELSNRVLKLLPEVGLYNLYGPTEAAIDVTHWTCTQGEPLVPIGRPIGNVQTHVLDAALNLVPKGVAGELYLGGAGLARGYLNRAGLTAERFVANPFDANGARLYRTGDLVRWRDDGALEYLGRIDHQVKIRGFRIELGEIEAQLVAQPHVREAVVTAQEGPGGARLIAYVTSATNGHTLDPQALREALSAQLPDYMVPAVVMQLDALPLSPNGKVDRKALPQPDHATTQYEAPQTETEQTLASIWQQVLKTGRIGRHDNFFELGGDSILSLQIVARARQAGWKLTPRQLFEQQTIQRLALYAERANHRAQTSDDIDTGEVPLLPIQARFFDLDVPNRHHWNQAVLLESQVALQSDLLERALRAVIAHHPSLRLRFRRDDTGTWTQTYEQTHDAEANIDADAAKLSLVWSRVADHSDAIAALCDDAQRSLDLEHGPLIRAVSIALADGTTRVLLAIHHLVVDGVSWRILLDDLQTAYRQLLANEPVALLPGTSSLQTWSTALVSHAATDAVRNQLSHWTRVLRSPVSLPADRPHGSNAVRDMRQTTLSFDRDLTRRLLQAAPAAYRTQVNDLLLTALGRALCAWTGHEDIRIDLEGHGREDLFGHIDLSRTVGWFTSLFPVSLAACGELGDAIRRVKESLRTVPERGLGFGLLRYLGAEEEQAALACAERSQVLFNYLGQFDQNFERNGPWRLADESSGQWQDDDAPLEHDLTFDGKVYDGALTLTVSFSAARYDTATIASLLDGYRAELEAVIAHCTSGASGFTPSDFPLAALDQAALDALPIPAARIDDLYPLSSMQAGMLFHALYEPAGAQYVNQLRLDIDGLDAPRFRSAWEAATARHPVLRTGFVQHGEDWLQWVANGVALPVAEYDWRDQATLAAALADALDTLAQTELNTGFDLTRPPLQRLVLVRTGASRHHLIWTHHHLLMDGWSVSQLLSEVLRAYGGQALAAQAYRYRDYIGWLRRRDMDSSEAYWRRLVSAVEGPTRLTGTLPADDRRDHDEHVARFDEALTARMADFARTQRVTVNTLVQGVWSLVLSRLTGQRKVSFGATVSGRPGDLAGVEQTLGLFINTVPVVAELREGAAVGEWLRGLQAQGLATREHEHTPLAEIQKWAGAGSQGLFDTVVVFENYPVDRALKDGAPDGLTFAWAGAHEQTNFALTLVATLDDTLELKFSYLRDHVGQQSVERLARQVERLLAAMVEDGQRALGALSLVDEVERSALFALARSDERYAETRAVHEVIGERARRQPDAVAVVFGERRVSYGELEERANRLAHRLIKLGVGPEVRVGIAVERSVEMVVGLLAILKAGGAYVPLDPEYPRERLAYMLEDSGITLLLTQSWIVKTLPVAANVRVVELDTEDVSTESAEAPHVQLQGENLAYVIYTSGSTGKPKGAANRHSALTNRLVWMQSAYALNESDVVLQKTPFSFDVSVWEFFWPLMYGAKLAVAEPGAHRDPQKLVELIHRHDVTTLHFVPSMLQAFVAHQNAGTCCGLKRIVCSGEALPAELSNRTLKLLPEVGLYNLYGPTEAAIDVTHWTCTQGEPLVPIGRPIGNVQTHVLDAALNLVPKGVAGELYLGGAGLARGYLNRAGLTAERFVANPFDANGARLYRTGDLVRWRDDGALEYLGRIDHQVKIRGFRIELGEIEAQLAAQLHVREAVVTAQEGPGGARLIAYVTSATNGHTLDPQALREALSAQLPDYMVPAVVMQLDALPLSPNGKVDRKALPQPDHATTQYEAPQTGTEQTLASIWQQVLKTDRIGRHDNFFELGGDSILSLKVVARAAQAGIALTPRQLFEAQTVAALAQLTGNDTAITSEATSIPLTAHEHGTHIPLSYAQQRLWFLWNLDPRNSAYHMGGGLRLSGELDNQAVQSALHTVIARHDALRTTFSTDRHTGIALQHLSAASQPDFRFADLSASDDSAASAQREARAREWAQAFVNEPFDLTTGPVLRTALLRLDARTHLLLVSMHHIVADAWSVDVLLREFLAAYRAIASGEAAALAPAPLQYADYAAWQREWLDAGERQRQLQYWQTALGDEHPVLALPTDKPRQLRSERDAAHCVMEIPAELGQRVRSLAKAHGATSFVVFLAAFQALLHRYSGQRDIRVGVPVANRQLPQTQEIIGCFINLLVMRSTFSGRMRVGDLLSQVRDNTFAAQRHQDLPFDLLVEALQPERSLAHAPLFQVLFNFRKEEAQTLTDLTGLQVESYEAPAGHAQFELALNVDESADGRFTLDIAYAADLWHRSSAERIVAHYVRVLDAFAASAERFVDDIELLDAAERGASLAHGRAAAVAPYTEPVHLLIAEQARSTPDKTALISGNERVTYAELDARANQLAHYLRAQGVEVETRVGIALTRSVEMLVGLLAILKAGGAYVPLDPDYPAGRLHYMMEHSGMKLLLTQRDVERRLSIPPTLTRIAIDDPSMQADLRAADRTSPRTHYDAQQLAYVIYTSGSTGRPKGVMVTHDSLTNFLLSMQREPGLENTDTLVAVTSLSFDIAALELYLPLVVGATLVVASRDTARDGEALRDLLARQRATVMQATPSTWRLLLAAGGPVAPIRGWCGGEALPAELAASLARAGVDLWNLYGPTETTIWSSSAHVEHVERRDRAPSLGRPISDTELLVLDDAMNLVPEGVAGELYIGGAGLARGYLHQPGLTAARFVAHPFRTDGARLYRTGDVVRWHRRGAASNDAENARESALELDYLGRADHQVKVRGFRIELQEIEAALQQQPGVEQAIVRAWQDGNEQRLAAYVTAAAGRDLDVTTLHDGVAARLPDYMVPASIVVLEHLPLTPNGKIDRRALPAPAGHDQPAYVAPEGEFATALAAVWARVLGVPRVGLNDDFFALGGHSLLAMQLRARLLADLALDAPLAWLFRHARFADYLRVLNEASSNGRTVARRGDSASLPALTRVERTADMPLAPLQIRLWVAERMSQWADGADAPQSSAYNMSAALRLTGALSAQRVQLAVDRLIERHEALRTCFPDREGHPVAVIAASLPLALEHHDLSEFGKDERERRLSELTATHASRPFALADGPLLRVALVRLAEDRHDLLFAIHHIVSDEWSMSVLTRDFSALYRALGDNHAAAPLPALVVQYADYAVWQRAMLDGELIEAEKTFWRGYLAGACTVAQLRTDLPRPAVASQAGASVRVVVSAPVVAKLKTLAASRGATPYMALLAAFQIFMHRLTGQSDLLVGADVAGRPHPALNDLVGFFVNVLPVRSRLVATGQDSADRVDGAASADMPTSFTQFLDGVRDGLLQVIEHQALPFDRIVETAGIARDTRWNPLVQVLFVMQNTPHEDFSIPGLDVAVLPSAITSSKFDMALFVNETDRNLNVDWVYSTSLFEQATIQRYADAWCLLLEEIVSHPDSLPVALTGIAAVDSAVADTAPAAPVKDKKLDKLGKLDRLVAKRAGAPGRTHSGAADQTRAATGHDALDTPDAMVRLSFPSTDQSLPLVVEPKSSDLDPAAWASEHRAYIETLLQRHGVVLFRHFALRDARGFEAFAEAISPGLYGGYGDLPKSEGGQNTYRSTPYPEKEMILFHNESSHLDRWPRKQWFYCDLPSKVGGATPVVDCREVLRRLSPEVARTFASKGLTYVRTFSEGLDVPWQSFFKTGDRHEVEARCARAGIGTKWLDNDELQIRTIAPAVITHPSTGERSFFNQIQLHHPHFLNAAVRDDLLTMVGRDRLPRNVTYGDGTDIPVEVLDEVGRAYESCAIRFEWRAGDVAMLDNMLVAHARDPYEEPRRIVVAMGEMTEGRDVVWTHVNRQAVGTHGHGTVSREGNGDPAGGAAAIENAAETEVGHE